MKAFLFDPDYRQISASMFDELTIYKQNGHFFFQPGNKLTEVCNAPEKPGVYIIYQLRKGKVRLVYIGASGTINQKGTFSAQLLKGRLTRGKQDGVPRQEYFETRMKVEEIDGLDIYWWVTFIKPVFHLPAYVEALIIQRHFEQNGTLPDWNKEF